MLLKALFLVLLATSGLRASMLPEPPASSRVLTLREVKNFWINSLAGKPPPSRPLGLHPAAQSAWDRALSERNQTIRAIRAGQYDQEAELVMLQHNASAWRSLGNDKEANAALTRWQGLREHLARMEVLASQRAAAQAQTEAAERLSQLADEISSSDRCCH